MLCYIGTCICRFRFVQRKVPKFSSLKWEQFICTCTKNCYSQEPLMEI